ncbi:MAG TPA: aromatic amino acid ammonia-lyase [Streptosporangiaceae bacterium]|nr:aromatic amino acid ammonia-lyase [Streptosporangiaceae bacterium]
MIVLDGTSLTCAEVAAIGRRLAPVGIGEGGRGRAAAAAVAARSAAEQAVQSGGAVYGRTTGVGFNRGIEVAADDQRLSGLRLLRSHAAGAGPPLAPETGLGMLAVRANQIAAGGSGVDAGVLDVLADCVNRGFRPPALRYGAIGTGDLTALAATGLCLLGERDWLVPESDELACDQTEAAPPRFALDPGDVLAFMSSNATTLAEAAIACADLTGLLASSTVIAALSHVAAGASAEPYAEAVQAARPHPGQIQVAREMRRLLAGQSQTSARVQDPYGFRALPQVHGAAVDALGHAERVVACEMNSAAENPLIDVARQRTWHNANFHTAYLALALDSARAAVFQTAGLSAARIGALLDDRVTGLATFLAMDVAPSSGLMMVEYAAHSALADISRLAAPAVLGGAVLSVGAEEHAGFGTQAAWSATETVRAFRVVLACELVAAVRALRLRDVRPRSAVLAQAFDVAHAVLPVSMADRPPDEDLIAASQLLAGLADPAASAAEC